MFLFRFLVFWCVTVSFIRSNLGDETQKVEKDPDILFDSESDSALFATVAGSWKSYIYEGEKMIRLTPEPLQESRVELGAILGTYDVTVSAKVLGREKGRLKPRMGVGIFGGYGFTLRLAPARQMLELVQYGEVIAESPCNWDSAQWYSLELRMEARKDRWHLAGRVWKSGLPRPEQPQLEHDAFPSTMPHALFGRAFLTGSPFNGFPIFYDEVRVRKNTPR